MLNIKAFLRANGNWSCKGSVEATRWVVVETQNMSDQVLASIGSCIKYRWDDSIQCGGQLWLCAASCTTDVDVDSFTNFSITQSWSTFVGLTNSTKAESKTKYIIIPYKCTIHCSEHTDKSALLVELYGFCFHHTFPLNLWTEVCSTSLCMTHCKLHWIHHKFLKLNFLKLDLTLRITICENGEGLLCQVR